MGRIIGSKNSVPRKDIGKKRKMYAGKPVKIRKTSPNFTPYASKRRHDDPVKIMFFQVRPMSKDGYMNWNKKARRHLYKNVFFAIGGSYPVNPEDISTPEKIGEVAIDILQMQGNFQFRMFIPKKNKGRVSPCKRADVIIQDTEDGLRARVINYDLMKRYFFWAEK